VTKSIYNVGTLGFPTDQTRYLTMKVPTDAIRNMTTITITGPHLADCRICGAPARMFHGRVCHYCRSIQP
jgi:hypothetical protein